MGTLFKDAQGNTSSKRVFGALLVLAGIASNLAAVGDPATTQVMIWAGVASLGVGVLETKVNK